MKRRKKLGLPMRPKVRQSPFAKSIYAAIQHNISILAENSQLPITSTDPSKQVPLKLSAFDIPRAPGAIGFAPLIYLASLTSLFHAY